VIDSNDRERFQDSRKELNSILEAPEMTGVPVVVLANKQDLPNAAGCSQVAEVLHLPKLTDRYDQCMYTLIGSVEFMVFLNLKTGSLIVDIVLSEPNLYSHKIYLYQIKTLL